MSTDESSYTIKRGKLHGPNGSWSINKISAIYKREGGKIGIKKWLITLAGLTAGSAVISAGTLPFVVISGGSLGYMMHRTLRVFAMIEGAEVELLCEVYWEVIWGEDRANSKCDELIALVTNAQK